MPLTINNIRHLKAFEAAARYGSISRAAVEVNLSQSAVSQLIARLEQDLGVELLHRRRTGSFLTRFGVIFRIRVERALQQINNALLEAIDAARSERGGSKAMPGNVTANQIRALIAIEENRSFAAAARAIGISQAALNRSARDLERNLRHPLFRRTPDGKTTNRVGANLAHRLRVAMREIEYGLEELATARGESHGTVLIGVLPLGGTLLLSRSLIRLTEAYPRVRVMINESPYEALLAWLRAGVIDVIIGTLWPHSPEDDVVPEALFPDPYCVVVRPSHPLARLDTVTEADLSRYEWILPRRDTPRRRAVDSLLRRLPSQPPALIETSSMATIRDLLFQSDRVTLLSRDQILFEEQMGLLMTVVFRLPHADRVIGTTRRADWLPTDVQKAFLHCLHDECRLLELVSP